MTVDGLQPPYGRARGGGGEGETLNVTHPGAFLFHISLACIHVSMPVAQGSSRVRSAAARV